MAEGTKLIVDGLIIVVYFVSIIAIGLYMGRRENSLHDFALGGRNVPWWAVMASIIAAETSAATFLGVPGEGYDKRSLAYVQLIFGLILGRILVGFVFLKPYYTYRVYTVYDYLSVRFGPKTKNYISGLFLIMRTLASGTRLFVPSLVMVIAWQLIVRGAKVKYGQGAVSTVTEYSMAIIILTILTCIYTAMGGIKAVIWTDVIQATLMFGSAIIAVVLLLYHIGGDSWNLMNGFAAVGRDVPQMKGIEGYFMTGFEPRAVSEYMAKYNITAMSVWHYVKLVLCSEYTVFSAIIGTTIGNMAAFGTDQDMVQRLLTAETYQKSRRSLITAAVMDLPIAAAFTFIGILLFVYYKQDPTYKPDSSADVFGSYIINVMPVGLRGLVLAGVFATAMGSLSAALNALATSFTNDWFIPYFARGKKEKYYVGAARVFTAVFAVLMIVIAVLFARAKVRDPNVRIIPVVLGIAGFILGPMLGVFLLGMLTRSRGRDGWNIVAVTLGLLTTTVLGKLHIDLLKVLGVPEAGLQRVESWQKSLPEIKFTWYAVIGAAVVLVVGLLASTPKHVLEAARRRALQAHEQENRPMALRD